MLQHSNEAKHTGVEVSLKKSNKISAKSRDIVRCSQTYFTVTKTLQGEVLRAELFGQSTRTGFHLFLLKCLIETRLFQLSQSFRTKSKTRPWLEFLSCQMGACDKQ